MLKDSPNGLSFLTHFLFLVGANIAGFVKVAKKNSPRTLAQAAFFCYKNFFSFLHLFYYRNAEQVHAFGKDFAY